MRASTPRSEGANPLESRPRKLPPLGRLGIGAAAAALLVLLWAAAARAIGAEIILPAPLSVLREAFSLYPSSPFLEALCATFLRGLVAFGLSAALGALAGFLSGLFPAVEAALAPLLTVIRATPVLALILLALLWFPSGFVPIFSAFLMAFPVMVSSAAEGARAVDPRLLEMSLLFRVPSREILLRLRLPAALPHLLSGARSALGLSWKVVVAGEVLSQPILALGSGMQESRVLLETPRVFAWAAAAVLLCGLTEWLFGRLASGRSRRGL